MEVSGVNDSADPSSSVDFTSKNEDRISVTEMPMISPATIMALPKGQAFALLEGGNLWKIRMPLPSKLDDDIIPKNLQEISKEMTKRYLSNDHWWAS